MQAVSEIVARAVAAHESGRLAEAERLYRQVLHREPGHVLSHNNLGLLLAAQGDAAAAAECFRRAVALRPDFTAACYYLGKALAELGDLEAAKGCYQRVLAQEPDHPEVHHELGTLLHGQGDLAGAIECYRRALALAPRYAEARNNLGVAYFEQRDLTAAVAAYRQAVALKPDYADAYHNLGLALLAQGDPTASIDFHRRAISLRPDYAEAHCNLGIAFFEQGDPTAAIECYRRAISFKPGYPEAHRNLGNALHKLGDSAAAVASLEQALALAPGNAGAANDLGVLLVELGDQPTARQCFERAIKCKPDFAAAYKNLGTVLTAEGEFDQAVRCYERALALKPDDAEAHFSLGNALWQRDRLGDAIAAYRQAIALRPGYPEALAQLAHVKARVCDWRDAETEAAQVLAALRGQPTKIPPYTLLGLPSTPADQLLCAEQWVEGLTKGKTGIFSHQRPASPRKLRLGYLSADFRVHAVASLIAEMIERHDRSRFEVAAYSLGPDDRSDMRRRLMMGFDRFTDLRPIGDAEAARQIHADGIDILIDLTGYTAHSRTRILAWRPAPIQVNFLGYPGTMGAEFIDYIIVDPFIAPSDQQPFYAERLVHLPNCYLPNDTKRKIAEATPSRQESGLPAQGFVFCCFNNPFKITPAVFDVWMRLLETVPGSVLWLRDANVLVKDNLRRAASERAVAPERLVFAPQLPLPDHLARHRLADLFLDTLPYNAHTTASDALWAGLPVLSCAGATFPGRVAGSLLRAVGLPELITSSLEDYGALAQKLASEEQLLAALRGKLARNRSTAPLFDIVRFTHDIEAVYLRMWDIWRSAEDPRAFALA